MDDLYQQHFAQFKPHRPGQHPQMSDREVLTLALCAQWHGTSERAFLRFASQYWRAYFPRLLSQSATNRRCRDLAGVLSNLSGMVAQEMESYAAPDDLPRRHNGQEYVGPTGPLWPRSVVGEVSESPWPTTASAEPGGRVIGAGTTAQWCSPPGIILETRPGA